MNINFKEITIQGFRSVENIHLTLNNQGIVVVKGINDYEDTASSNGSGKSSIFEAIIFALFEETSSGEKDVENRILKNGYNIELSFNIDGIDYKIIRSLNNGKTNVTFIKNNEDISARNKTDTNKLILNELKITKDIFLDSILLSQNVNTNLASLTPTARKERLELLTNTNEIIDNFKDNIKQKQILYEQKCTDSSLNISKLTGNKETTLQQIQTIKTKIESIKEEIKRKEQIGDVANIENQIKDLQTQINNINNDTENLIQQVNKIEEQINELNTNIPEYNENIQQIQIKIEELRNEYNKLDKQIETNKVQISYFQNNKIKLQQEINEIKNSDTCPTCGRKYDNINELHIQEKINNKLKEIDKIEQQENELSQSFIDINKQLTKIEDKIKQQQELQNKETDKIKNIQKEQDQLKTRITNINYDKDNNYKQIQQIQTQITDLNNKKQELNVENDYNKIKEYEDTIQEFELQVQKINTNIENYNNIFNQNNDYVEVCKHILQLITKDFRTYLLKNSINYINNLLKNYSTSLFSNEKDLIYVEDDNSKLNIKLGEATYESLSGGEKTRVDIALLLAQKSLASTIGNISSNIIILDEVLKYCDSATEINIVDLLVKELDTLESIYMISHKEIPIGYDNQIIVSKNKEGLSNLL